MPSASLYHPVWFYLITITIAFALGPITTYLCDRKGLKQLQFPLLLLALCVPCITAITMIYSSHSEVLIGDFWRRLFLIHWNPVYLLFILLFMPCIICLATWISLFFGYSKEQFSLTKELSVMKGWSILGIVIPLILAPLVEELGWRGYGVDSLRVYFNLFTTSLLFGFLWAVWHLPAFFMKGFYHNQLWHQGKIYVLNFFVSVFVVAILMNWVYYKTGRSIPAVILFHSILNLSSMVLRTEQFTKCIATLLITIVTILVIVYDNAFFF